MWKTVFQKTIEFCKAKKAILFEVALVTFILLIGVISIVTRGASKITFKTAHIEDERIAYIEVSNDTESFSFEEEITKVGKGRYAVYKDWELEEKVEDKVVALEEGDNTYYVNATKTDDGGKLYKMIIRRRPLYNISFDTLGGSQIENQLVEEGSLVVKPESQPTKLGYTFAGWMFDYNNRRISQDTTIKVNPWVANTYTIKFDKGEADGQEVMEDQVFTYDQIAKLSKNAFTYTDHKFAGWLCNGAQYGDLERICNLTAENQQEFTFVAQWRNKYTVKFDKNGEDVTGEMLDFEMKYGQEINLPKNTLERVGYKFAGWKLGKNVYQDQEIVSNLADIDGTATLRAQWEPNTYTVKFDKGNAVGQEVMQEEKFIYGQYKNLKQVAFTNEGFRFVGWKYNGQVFKNCERVGNLTSEDGAVITLVAQWSPFRCLENETGLTIIGYLGNDKNIVIPEEIGDKKVTKIGASSFHFIRDLQSVVIPDSVTSIEKYAFYECEDLKEVTLSSNLISIGKYAFYKCSLLESVIIPQSVNLISENVFLDCASLNSVIFQKPEGWSTSLGEIDYNLLSNPIDATNQLVKILRNYEWVRQEQEG